MPDRRAFLKGAVASTASAALVVAATPSARADPHAPPHRLSIRGGDPGHENLIQLRSHGLTATIYLDGEKVDRCITADEDTGYVLSLAERGGRKITSISDLHVERWGAVKIVVSSRV